jgi:adenylate cyclase
LTARSALALALPEETVRFGSMAPASNIERKLAVILAADVVAYSAIAEADEFGAVLMLRELRELIIKPSLAKHGGRLFKEMGDCFLAEFGDAVEATLAAADIQRTLKKMPEADDVPQLRIAVHSGNVIVEGSDLLGDAINIASRIQAFAPPGGLCVTGVVHEEVSRVVALDYHALGPRQLKNMTRAVTLFEVEEAALLGIPAKRVAPRAARPPVIAVLPFDNLGGAADMEYLCDGIPIEIIAALSRFHSVRVLSSTSSFAFRQATSGAANIAQSLGADYILQGSLIRRGMGWRLVVALIEGETGASCWAETRDYADNEVLSLQGRLAESIANMLENRVFQSRLSRIEHAPAETVAAHDCWLRGQFLLNQWTSEGDDGALQWFQRAILQDPNFARAHASIAAVYITRRLLQPGNPREAEDSAKAMKHSRLAIKIDPMDARNHVNHAWVLMQTRDFDGGYRHFEAAERLNPYAPDILISCAMGAAYLDSDEKARRLSGRAFDLNPLYPDHFLVDLAMIRFLGGEYQEASEIGRQVRQAIPEMGAWIAAALGLLGRKEEAVEEAHRFLLDFTNHWRGGGSPSPAQAVSWFLAVNPVKSATSRSALIEGLGVAGLPVNGMTP